MNEKKISVITTGKMPLEISMDFAKELFNALNDGMSENMSWSEIQEAYKGKDREERKEFISRFRAAGVGIGLHTRGNEEIRTKVRMGLSEDH